MKLHFSVRNAPGLASVPAGVGLGLSNAQNIVAGHDGWLTAENDPGGGTRVTVWLPVGNNSQNKAA